MANETKRRARLQRQEERRERIHAAQYADLHVAVVFFVKGLGSVLKEGKGVFDYAVVGCTSDEAPLVIEKRLKRVERRGYDYLATQHFPAGANDKNEIRFAIKAEVEPTPKLKTECQNLYQAISRHFTSTNPSDSERNSQTRFDSAEF